MFRLKRILVTVLAISAFCFAQRESESHPSLAAPPAHPRSQQPDEETPSYTFRATTRMVIVQVVARDKEDNPVRDLSAGDLRVSETIGESPVIPEKIASLVPINDVATQRSTNTTGIVLGWLHRSFCPLTGAYELSYYISPESHKDGLHRISVTSVRPGIRLFFRPGYKIESDMPAQIDTTELPAAENVSHLPKQQLIAGELKRDPPIQLAQIACYDTLHITSIHLDVRKVDPPPGQKKESKSRPPIDSYEFAIPPSYFASLSATERSQPRQLDFAFCKFENGGRPIHEVDGSLRIGATPQEWTLINDQGLVHTISIERERCAFAGGSVVCSPPLEVGEMQKGIPIQIAYSGRLVVRDRQTGALGSAEILLSPLPKDQFPAPIPEGETNDSFGIASSSAQPAMCGDVYELAPWTTNLPLFSELDAIAPLYATSFGVYSRFFTLGIPGVTSRTEWFGINYQGTFGIDTPGKYEFSLLSDDGAKVYIDENLVVSDDTIHPTQKSRGNTELTAGAHDIRISYFQGPRIQVSLVFLIKPPGRPWRLFDIRDFPTPEQPSYQRRKLPISEKP